MTETTAPPWTVPGYDEIRDLGRGATGRVVLAEHAGTGRLVAVKYLADELAQSFREDFRAEARVLADVEHPNVVRLWEYVESPAGAAIVMELVDGVELRTMLDEQGPTAPESALWVLKGSLLGLAAAHARGVVHRDYKPANVMVDADGRSVLTDFGIAGRSGADVVTAGTPLYMAPEQWVDGVATTRSDMYAATATFVECLTGHPPYPADDVDLLRRRHEHAPVPVDEVPEPVRSLVARGMAKSADERPADAAVFVAELEAAAVAGYGEDWEERGRRGLAERAAPLALLFPLAAGTLGGTAIATTVLGDDQAVPRGGSRSAAILIGAAVVALAAGVVGAVLAGTPSSGTPTFGTTSVGESTGVAGTGAGGPTPSGGGVTPGAGVTGTVGAGGTPGAPGAPGLPGAGAPSTAPGVPGRPIDPATGTPEPPDPSPSPTPGTPENPGTGSSGTEWVPGPYHPQEPETVPGPDIGPAPVPVPAPAPAPAPDPKPVPAPPRPGGVVR